MRKSREEAAQSRDRIVGAASRMLRSRGVEGTSLAEVMQAAGMTHGGFYKHFASKDELADLAARAAFREIVARFDERASRDGAEAARDAYFADYLSTGHVAHPELGCPVAAFGADAGRMPATLAAAFAEGADSLIARIGGMEGRAEAIRKLVAMVGAVVVARAVGEGPLRDEILAACAPK